MPSNWGTSPEKKTEIAIRVGQLAPQHGLAVNVDWREEARIYGDNWLDFLSSGRATLGTESGASIVDFDRSISTAVESYRAAHASADYQEVARAVLAPHEGNIIINTISPRMFESICVGTALVLFPGEYSGILEPWRHYIPLAKDFSNFSEVVRLLRDIPYLEHLTRTAREDIVESGRYSFGAFTRQIDDGLARLLSERHPSRARMAAGRSPQDRESWRDEIGGKVARVVEQQAAVAAAGGTIPGGASLSRRGDVGITRAAAAMARRIMPAGVRTALRRLAGI